MEQESAWGNTLACGLRLRVAPAVTPVWSANPPHSSSPPSPATLLHPLNPSLHLYPLDSTKHKRIYTRSTRRQEGESEYDSTKLTVSI